MPPRRQEFDRAALERNSYFRILAERDIAPRIKAGEVEIPPIIPTGIIALDNKLDGGIPREKLCVIAARTSHGKTATAVRFAVNMCRAGQRVNVIWLEDDEFEFDMRAISALSGEPLRKVKAARRAGELDAIINTIPDEVMERWGTLTTHAMDNPHVSLVCERILSMPRNSVCLIDHLGEIRYDQGPRYESMGQGLRDIRAAARAAKVLVIAMTQLNRDWDRRKAASEKPDSVRPVLSDIENSGQIEQIARYCVIAEKRHKRVGDEEVPTGEYVYHVWKPYVTVAICKWDDRTSTPDNLESVDAFMPKPVESRSIPVPYSEKDDDD